MAVLGGMSELYGLTARLLYGTGMRLRECMRLRVKDVDFARAEIGGGATARGRRIALRSDVTHRP